jgi:hypothetical protein
LLETQREQMGAVAAMVLSTPENILVEHAGASRLAELAKISETHRPAES